MDWWGWALLVVGAWCAVGVVVAVLAGRSVTLADEMETTSPPPRSAAGSRRPRRPAGVRTP